MARYKTYLTAVCFVGVVASMAAFSEPLDDSDPTGVAVMQSARDDVELHAALLSWAVTLSGLPYPARAPRVQRMPHEFFVRNACGGRECKVMGWFPPGMTIYLDQRLDPENNLLAASIVVHEMVHFLQFQAARTAADFSCVQTIELERQAYGVQREFITRYGVYQPVGASMHHVGCDRH